MPDPSPPIDDPVLVHARREALWIAGAWLVATVWTCTASYLLGYSHAGRTLGPEDVRPILGIPRWVFWGYLVPWAACGVFTLWFTATKMVDDDLGRDRSEELDEAIRREADVD